MNYFKRKNGTQIYINVDFEFMGKKFSEDINLPFDIFIESFRYYSDYKDVKIDGRDSKIWNLLVDLDVIDKLEDNKNFLDICKELYLESPYFEEDFEEWEEERQDDYDFENKKGKYAEE
jgi:hypothetical protein